tara:strand:+ start:1070 stop:2506 length:1437 start_codon:yes stop_codon:yes gene_type:complete
MANSIIEQEPKFKTLPVGQEIVFVVSNDTAVANETKVKFIAEVHIGTSIPNPSTNTNKIATFKTTPNNAGVGIFDFKNIVENFVSSDNIGGVNSKYKDEVTSDTFNFPIHLVDKFSLCDNSFRYLVIQFKVEFLGADTSQPNIVSVASGTAANSDVFRLFNGYLKRTDVLTSDLNTNNFGFDLQDFEAVATFPTANTRSFLTNAATQLYANLEDYGTIGILQTSSTLWDNARTVKFTYYSSSGAVLGNDEYTKNQTNGAFFGYSADHRKQIAFVGVYPANLRNDTSNTFTSLVNAGTVQGGYYTIEIRNSSGLNVYQTYTVNLNCPDEKQFESIRLCWLNQWGAWDYYTFTKKSTRTLSTQKTTYNQLEGTWNDRVYKMEGFQGGKKTFRVNATESIRMNTDFISVNDNTVLEELINSPEVYLLQGFQADPLYSLLNQYVTPVRLKTSSFTRKTVANDKLIQYTFEIEKSKTFRTQSI